MNKAKSCLIVGAGMAGLTAGRVLHAAGWSVVLLDKGRGFGGRMATRRIGESTLDHGAQFFTVRDRSFAEAVEQWEAAGWVTPWYSQEGHTRYRGVGGMNALARHLAVSLDVRREVKVERVEPMESGWRVAADGGQVFEAGTLLITAPAPQAADLLAGCTDELGSEFMADLRSVEYDPCFSLLLTLDGPSHVPSPGYVRPGDGPIAWIADNTQKGVSSAAGAALTVHATPEFTREYFDADKEQVTEMLLEAADPFIGALVTASQLHRWKFSRPIPGARPMFLSAEAPGTLLVAGDGFGGPRVEGAFLSGLGAADRIITPR